MAHEIIENSSEEDKDVVTEKAVDDSEENEASRADTVGQVEIIDKSNREGDTGTSSKSDAQEGVTADPLPGLN